MRCDHPAESLEIRRFRFVHGSYFAMQCGKCQARIGRKLDPTDLPIHPRKVRWAEKRRGATGLGGSGNSRRRELQRYYHSAAWKRKREKRLHMDDYTCQSCEGVATEVHHLRYPEVLGRESVEHDLVSSCRECNLGEREQRITRSVLGCQ